MLSPQFIENIRKAPFVEIEALINVHNKTPITSIRKHQSKYSNIYLEKEQVLWCQDAYYLEERPVFTLDPLFHSGAYYVQEASSLFLDFLVKNIFTERKNLRVLDLCAAPGGKTTLLTSLLDDSSLLLSNEVIRSRASILEENVVRWGYTNNWVCSNDPKDIGKLKGYFDLIVVDAPCSGSGLFRKDARAIDEWSEANVLLCSQRQQRILADVWPALKENGVIIYATCSYSVEEDEAILQWLQESFAVSGFQIEVPHDWGIITSQVNNLCGYRFYPDKVKGEGFFIAAIQKKETAETIKPLKQKSLHDEKNWSAAKHFLTNKDYRCLPLHPNEYHAINALHEQDFYLLKQFVYLRKLGVQLGSPSAKEWIPSHEIALSIDRNNSLPSFDLSKEQALKFLKKENFETTDLPKGWLLLTYQGLGLGWIKSLGNRFNNYLPKHWRIRMEIPDEDWQ
jgi:16S rRNA C967 or C1407 C5-methylase (RsmB/RsmF family)/NOL1/NOP2/fmu family ribosome biogenesis protein